jgi:hypothetical protein
MGVHVAIPGARVAIAALLDRHLPAEPPNSLGHRFAENDHYLRARALRSVLRDEGLQLVDVAPSALREHFESEREYSTPDEYRRFRARVGPLLPWHLARARALIGADASGLEAELDDFAGRGRGAWYDYGEWTIEEIVELWFSTLVVMGAASRTSKPLEAFVAELARPITPRTWVCLARRAARAPTFKARAHA